MAEKTFLIVSNSNDAHVHSVVRRLNERSIRAHQLNSDMFVSIPRKWSISQNESKISSTLFVPEVDAVWYRKVLFPEATTAVQSFIRQELEGLFDSILAQYENCRWVNSRTCISAARPKISQLQRAKELGFRIPDTLITNDVEELRRFASSHQGRIVAKPIRAQVVESEGEFSVIGTRSLTPEHYESATNSCPGYFQERLPLKSEIRVIVFGKRIYPFRLTPQKEADDIKQLALEDIKHERCRLDESISDKIEALLSSYALEFGAIDLADIDDGEPMFFELNPNGQWLWLQHVTGENLIDPFIDLLCS
ncbi:hypothetical protein KGQ25_01010 [Patescibacteria group bacterium]|nr:hypothetical protein [Patescibacteria group bacterium]MDE2173334.1 hypothetical protein [Patescibacteria group bacterium]